MQKAEHPEHPPLRYPVAMISLHWLVAALVLSALLLGWSMTGIPGLNPTKLKYFSWHKWLGVSVLLLWLPRVLWRWRSRLPSLPARMPLGQQRLAHAAHGALYLLLLAVPLSGLLYSQAAGVPVVYLGIWRVPALLAPDPHWKMLLKSLHVLLNYSLASLLALHVLAAFKHQFIERDQLLARMLPGRRPRT